MATHTAGSPPPSQMFTPCNGQWQQKVQPGWGQRGSLVIQWERLSFWATCESACPVAQVRLNIYSKKFSLRINAVTWLSGISVQTRLQTPHHPFTGPILLGPPCRSTKWIYWPALSALVRCSNETALSAHHLSACQPASWSTVPTVSVCVLVWGMRFNSVA